MTSIKAPFTEETLEPLLRGKEPWPFCEEIDLKPAINVIAAGAGLGATTVKYFREPGTERGRWARYFPGYTQGGQMDGTAYVLAWSPKGEPRAFRVKVCDHEPIEGAGANHRRGWHPAKCSKCGLDMSVDSGD